MTPRNRYYALLMDIMAKATEGLSINADPKSQPNTTISADNPSNLVLTPPSTSDYDSSERLENNTALFHCINLSTDVLGGGANNNFGDMQPNLELQSLGGGHLDLDGGTTAGTREWDSDVLDLEEFLAVPGADLGISLLSDFNPELPAYLPILDPTLDAGMPQIPDWSPEEDQGDNDALSRKPLGLSMDTPTTMTTTSGPTTHRPRRTRQQRTGGTIEKGDKCPHCEYIPEGDPQWHKGSMRTHVQTQHGEKKPLPCPYPGCKSVYNRDDNLKQHIRSKHGEERPRKRRKKDQQARQARRARQAQQT